MKKIVKYGIKFDDESLESVAEFYRKHPENYLLSYKKVKAALKKFSEYKPCSIFRFIVEEV